MIEPRGVEARFDKESGTIHIEAGDDVSFETLQKFQKALIKCLRSVERDITGTAPQTEYRVTKVSFGDEA